jgi:hypothetical protein
LAFAQPDGRRGGLGRSISFSPLSRSAVLRAGFGPARVGEAAALAEAGGAAVRRRFARGAASGFPDGGFS